MANPDPSRLKILSKEITVKVGIRKRLIPAGDYRARIEAIERLPSIKGKYAFHFTFRILDGPSAGDVVLGFVSANYEAFSEYTKLYQWYQAATGETLEPGETMCFEMFKRNILLVEVVNKASRRTKNEFSNVSLIKGVVCET